MYELTYGNSESEEFISYFSSEKEAIHYIIDFLDEYYPNYPYIRVIDGKEETEIDYGSHHWFYWIKKIEGPIKIEEDFIKVTLIPDYEPTGELDGYIVEELSYDPLLAEFKSGDDEIDSEFLLFHEDWVYVFNRDEEEGTTSGCGVAEGDDIFELFGITLVNVIRKKKNKMEEYIRLQKGEEKDGV
nr:MAG TPA: hypothetical protein [Caudoviricetes sp.]